MRACLQLYVKPSISLLNRFRPLSLLKCPRSAEDRIRSVHLRELNIGCVGGGTGLPSLLGGLKINPWLNLNAVVTMFDSGGSSGQLRDELGVLPPGDVLKCALALARNEREARRLGQRDDVPTQLEEELSRGGSDPAQAASSPERIAMASLPAARDTRKRNFSVTAAALSTYFSTMITGNPAWETCRACSSAAARFEKVPSWTRK